ncbi:MAG TPA: AmmeMemoRadiSam system protein B [Deltaproteobacteria bacterium]|nr:AmmeMemoRadiSam system protein B [Deltaproteobacteria bacterium]
MEETTHPRLRHDIQAVPITIEGRQLITFVDPLNISGTGFALDRRALPLLSLLDGRNDLRDIQTALMKITGGTIVPISEVQALIAQLDRAFLLESEAFTARKKAVMDDFAGRPRREPMLAGRSYDADPAGLKAFIASVEEGLPPLDGPDPDGISGILAPHIDIAAARDAYVDAYRRIRGRVYDLVIILGINHQGGQGLYSVTEKDYATPLGVLETDREVVARLREGLPDGTLAVHDFDHMTEHSIEFQTVFLAHYLGTGVKIVPILCGGIHEFLAKGSDPFEDERFRTFRENILGVVEEGRRKILLVSGVDFSHVGHKFGHRVSAEALIDSARANDRELIDHLLHARARDIYLNTRDTRDRYNVCGIASMMLFSSLMGPCRAELLHHGTYDEPATGSAVTFASMVFTRS